MDQQVNFSPLNYLSKFEYPEGIFTSIGQTGLGSLSLNRVYFPLPVTASQLKIGGSISCATNTSVTTASANHTLWMGIYTFNNSTLSLASSGSAAHNFAWSVSNSSTGNSSVNSMREMTVPMNVNITPGEYWIGAVLSQATTYTSLGFSIFGNPNIASAASAAFLSPIDTTAGNNIYYGQGIYTAAVSSGPSSILKAHINYTSASNVQRANYYVAFYNNTY